MHIARRKLVFVMKLLSYLTGGLSCALVVADQIHGHHNGDIHRTYIHVSEFACCLLFLLLAATTTFRWIRKWINVNPWLLLIPFTLISGIAAMVLFATSGGGFHGDGGPIASAFLAYAAIAEAAVLVALLGFGIDAVIRRNAGFPVLRR